MLNLLAPLLIMALYLFSVAFAGACLLALTTVLIHLIYKVPFFSIVYTNEFLLLTLLFGFIFMGLSSAMLRDKL